MSYPWRINAHRTIQRWFWDELQLRERVEAYVAVFAAFEGPPTLANMHASLFWRTHAQFMTDEQQQIFDMIWTTYAAKPLARTPQKTLFDAC